MPKTLGEWLLFVLFVLVATFVFLSKTIAVLLFFGSIFLGIKLGFDWAVLLMIFGFGFTVFGDFAVSVLTSRFGRLFVPLRLTFLSIAVRLGYLAIAAVLFYFLFSNKELTNHEYWISVVVGSTLALVNIPRFLLDTALCFPRFRNYLKELEDKLGQDALKPSLTEKTTS